MLRIFLRRDPPLTTEEPVTGLTSPASIQKVALVFALSLTDSACAVRPSPAGLPGPDALYSVVLNGRLVHVSGGSVLDLLSHPYAGSVARAYASTPRGEPVVLLDRVQLDGVYRLADVPAFHAASISVLRPVEARLRYGQRGSHGAILVTTKRGVSDRRGGGSTAAGCLGRSAAGRWGRSTSTGCSRPRDCSADLSLQREAPSGVAARVARSRFCLSTIAATSAKSCLVS